MDHKAFLATLTPEQRADLTYRSDAAGLRHLAGHLGAIGLSTAWISLGLPGWPIALFVQGVLLVFLFTLLHETSHQTPFASTWLNKVVGHLCGAILFLPRRWFRYFHMAHHRYTQIPGKDPELNSPKPEGWGAYLWHVSGVPVWRAIVVMLWRNGTGLARDDYVPDAKRGEVILETRVYLAGYGVLLGASVALQSWVLFWVWLLPLVLGQPFLRLYLLAEHGRCAYVANMLENTRTTYTSRVIRALAWNMPYHTEHHSYPAVPFYKLPELHKHMRPHLVETSDGYGAFHEQYVGGFGQSASARDG
ncbi:fatty acid desaturase [Roseobacteraceae bacterium S113]